MSPKITVVGLMLLATAACAPIPKPTVPPTPGAPGTGAEANAASPQADAKPDAKPAADADAGKPSDPQEPDMQAMPPTDVRTMKCAVINAAGDDDKAYASTFLLGYRSALAHMHVIDPKRIDSILQAAVAECAGKPNALAFRVFAEAEVKAYAADRAARRLSHRKPSDKALATTPAAASPQAPAAPAPAAEPSPSAEPPPMRYAPAQSASPPTGGTPAPADSSNTPPQAAPAEKPAPAPAKSDDKPAADTAPTPAPPPAPPTAPPPAENPSK